MNNNKKRVVIAGMGDTGTLVAVNLPGNYQVTGISTKPCLLSGQELGTRLAKPEDWKPHYLLGFSRFKKLDHVHTMQGKITAIDPDKQTVEFTDKHQHKQQLDYDILVIASGVTNGFWRNNKIQELSDINLEIDMNYKTLKNSSSISIIGGGPTGVSVAANLKTQNPEKTVSLVYSQDTPLPGYHPNTRNTIKQHLSTIGVNLYPHHRAVIPDNFDCDKLTHETVSFSTGQADLKADTVLWAVGNMKPNNEHIPKELLDDKGFVRADKYLRVPPYNNIFTLGDIAATDKNRSSARNFGFKELVNNIRYTVEKKGKLKPFLAPEYRWGSILGVQDDGLTIFTPKGGQVRLPKWLVNTFIYPVAVKWALYRGVRKQ